MADGNLFRNPSPPPELCGRRSDVEENTSEVDEDLARLMDQVQSDRIGTTTFSRRWALSVLVDLLTLVRSSPSPTSPLHEPAVHAEEAADDALELHDEMEVRLCQLWDAAIEEDVACFLLEHGTVEILLESIQRSYNPRLTEICVGVLGNLACRRTPSADLHKLIPVVIDLLSSSDSPTLVETTRLILSRITQHEEKSSWLTAFKDECVFSRIVFILHSSTNGNLLANTTQLVDNLLDDDEELALEWCEMELVRGLIEALKQASDVDSEFLFPIESNTVLALQTLSTLEHGVEILGSAHSLPSLLLSLVKRWTAQETAHQLSSPSFAALLSLLLLMLTTHRDNVLCALQQDSSVLERLEGLSKRLADRDCSPMSEQQAALSAGLPSTSMDSGRPGTSETNRNAHSSALSSPKTTAQKAVSSPPPSSHSHASVGANASQQGRISPLINGQVIGVVPVSDSSPQKPSTVGDEAKELLRQLLERLAEERSKQRTAASS